LTDVSYNVTAHFEFNRNRPDLEDDFCENKHYFIMKRCIEKGGRRDIFLGSRECQAYVEPAVSKSGYYASMGDMEFGLMYHSLSYPDENGQDKLFAKFWRPKMANGTIEFCRPDECEKEVFVKNMEIKKFSGLNFSNTDDTINNLGELEGDTI
jgi:CRISPR-associated protein Cas5d